MIVACAGGGSIPISSLELALIRGVLPGRAWREWTRDPRWLRVPVRVVA